MPLAPFVSVWTSLIVHLSQAQLDAVHVLRNACWKWIELILSINICSHICFLPHILYSVRLRVIPLKACTRTRPTNGQPKMQTKHSTQALPERRRETSFRLYVAFFFMHCEYMKLHTCNNCIPQPLTCGERTTVIASCSLLLHWSNLRNRCGDSRRIEYRASDDDDDDGPVAVSGCGTKRHHHVYS